MKTKLWLFPVSGYWTLDSGAGTGAGTGAGAGAGCGPIMLRDQFPCGPMRVADF